jgi:hypothetical protein
MAISRSYATAAQRWEGVGPYYAMFPTYFADQVVAKYTKPGEVVLDPFAGRGTAVFSAAHQGRHGLGVEVNPVGWVYAQAKLHPADKGGVAARINELAALSVTYAAQADELPDFFHHCFSGPIRSFLTCARDMLDWRSDGVDRTAMALLLVYLHGKRNAAFSNQMRQTKSMAPDYAIRWWKARDLTPPEFDPVTFMAKRLDWRYRKGVPATKHSDVSLGNAESEVPAIGRTLQATKRSARLLLTSPPYYSVTNYHYDQWLRLWLLGGPPHARRAPGTQDIQGKFENAQRYRDLLVNVFCAAARLMATDGVIYVRTGCGDVTLPATLEALDAAFPGYRMAQPTQTYQGPTQTRLFGDSGIKSGEIDIVLHRPDTEMR